MTTLATTARGVSVDATQVRVGDYVWHRGAFRLVTAREGSTIRMGRYASRWMGAWEVLPGSSVEG